MNSIILDLIHFIALLCLISITSFNALMLGIGAWHTQRGRVDRARATATLIWKVDEWLIPVTLVAMLWWAVTQ